MSIKQNNQIWPINDRQNDIISILLIKNHQFIQIYIKHLPKISSEKIPTIYIENKNKMPMHAHKHTHTLSLNSKIFFSPRKKRVLLCFFFVSKKREANLKWIQSIYAINICIMIRTLLIIFDVTG